MNSKLYKRAYKFLKLRANKVGFDALKAFSNLTEQETNKVVKFLSYNHQVKFI